MYGFTGEVVAKYSSTMSDMFTQVYNWLPLCHLLNNRVLVMHGGLFSDDNVTLEMLRNVDRNRQPPEEGIMCELLWSDPQPQEGRGPSKRGVGCQFGPDVTERFLKVIRIILNLENLLNDYIFLIKTAQQIGLYHQVS